MDNDTRKHVSLGEAFPYEYRGSGYFRLKGVPKGKIAKTLHADQAIQYLYDVLTGKIDPDPVE